MELRKIIRTDLAASAIAHLTLVALIILISEVHPFHAAPPETVTVDIVTPEQVKEEAKAEQRAQEEAREKPPEPKPDLKLPKLDFADKSDATAKQQAAPSPSPQASPEPQRSAQQQQLQKQPSPPNPREVNAQPQQPPQQALPQPMPQPPPQGMPLPPTPPSQVMQQPQAAPPPAYQAPEPDVTVKYGVMLGLPPELTELPKDAPKNDGGDAKDSIAAKLPSEVIAELRRHLKNCAKLPSGVAPTDNVYIKLRTVFATDGTLAREPILMEAPPSAKGVAIVKSAMSALQNCQPYKMLPADKYGEWKVLDLPFSPRDFGGG
ncbi:hypothetical protein IVB14_29995 [Bradyrhizobium sp. 180]|uniref:hypothetical protein n=1 Tax=unclassified Bradyrhizobium TaxID=2631580 RepID=UPI001FF7D1BF|nr:MULTISPECIES: hypothetical protein [unclassified Bradyrhizobium]MCK1419311.1 hypothetical protein [Bradyrhizobium sp. CW12]MCK1494529.1 hypothetical protein [Bradyrhizobium sp. 180]MCK1526972.1 hypothetical protein [Bradyrhizobium sp. 182]MCK1645314.1 hypothetical protein [Bradyrhizobium sp. 154]MCK1755100.1 hypothetical protein [Bradyrhizobium sp. 137]